ncbi:MAG: histidine kinase, partial [Bacteroidota bacterium]
GKYSRTARMTIAIHPPLWERWWFRLLALITLLGTVQFFVQSIQRRQRREEKYIRRIEQLRASALRSQMNPHFVFNTLNAILYFLLKNDRQTSIKYLSRFSKLIRSIFEHSKYDRVTLSEEIQFLENYLSLEHLRFSDRVTMDLHIDEHLRNSSISIPTLMVQPLLENAFKHGLFHKREKGILKFSVREELEGIVFEIEDNGIGRAESKLINQKRRKTKSHSSSTVIEERIQLINSKRPPEQPKIRLTITDLKNERGEALGTNCRLIFCY